MRSQLSAVLIAVFLTSCAKPFPDWSAADVGTSSEAWQWLSRAVRAHGGDAYGKFRDISVRYDGQWAQLIRKIQPEIVDEQFRIQSEERLLLGSKVTNAQLYKGPGGDKKVVSDGETISVFYNGDPAPAYLKREAAAMVADAYEMFLLGPSYLKRYGKSFRMLPEAREGGRRYVRLLAEMKPGYGFSKRDECAIWIDAQTELLYRVHFTLEGVESAAGGHVDTTFYDYRERAGQQWPTRFVERVRGPLSIPAHEWRLEGLDVNRGLRASELRGAGFSGRAKAPAQAWPSASD